MALPKELGSPASKEYLWMNATVEIDGWATCG